MIQVCISHAKIFLLWNNFIIIPETFVREIRITEERIPIAGQPYTLVCSTNATTNTLKWFGPDGQELSTGGRVQLGDLIQQRGTTSRTLTISELTEADLGDYICRSGRASVSKRVELQGTFLHAVFSS